MTYDEEKRKSFEDEQAGRPPVRDTGMSWGLPLGLATVAVMIALLFYGMTSERTATASNRTVTVTQQTSPPTGNGPTITGLQRRSDF